MVNKASKYKQKLLELKVKIGKKAQLSLEI